MSKKGAHTPIDDDEAIDMVRRMLDKDSESLRETASSGRWYNYVRDNLQLGTREDLTAAQWGVYERGRMLTYEDLPSVGITSMARYTPTATYMQYRDVKTGRFTSYATVRQRLLGFY